MAKHGVALIAFAVIAFCYVSNVSALIEGPGTYYGFELPEPFYNYWNYTTDIKEMKSLYGTGNFAAAANIYFVGKNNVRNATLNRFMQGWAARNASGEYWFDLYAKKFNNERYLADWIEAPLNGTGAFAGACCGVRAAALDVYLKYWQVSYAQHEADAGVRLNIADEAGHGFAVIASPVDEPDNYWNYIEAMADGACISDVVDPITQQRFTPANIAHRDTFGVMGTAIANEDLAAKAKAIADTYKVMEKQVMIQHMHVFMVYAKKSVYPGVQNLKDRCYRRCIRPANTAGAVAAWNVLKPLMAAGNQNSIASIEALFARPPFTAAKYITLKRHMATLAGSLGLDFQKQVFRCRK